MKKVLFLILFLFTTYSLAAAGTVTITNQYPSPAGIYDWLQNIPTDVSPPCTDHPGHTGRFYFDLSEVRMKYCNASLNPPAWVSLSGLWSEDTNNNIFLSGTTPQNKKIGIGTDTPIFRLTLNNKTGVGNPDGGIFARGILGGGSNLGLLPAASRPLAIHESYFIWHSKKGALRAGSLTSSGYVATLVNPIGQGLDWDDGWIGTHSVAFGQDTTALGSGSVVSGGERNVAYSFYSVIGGGTDNQSGFYDQFPRYTTVSGGKENYVRSSFGFIGGGSNNIAGDRDALGNITTQYTTIAGGFSNVARFDFSTIGGGDSNKIDAQRSTIAGGTQNIIDSFNVGNPLTDMNNFIGGGTGNQILGSIGATIGGGAGNIVQGDFATIIGGTGNQANTNNSVVIGSNLVVNTPGIRTIAIGNPNAATPITQADAIILLPQGNVGIGTVSPAQKLDVLGAVRLRPIPSLPAICDDGTLYSDSTKKGLCYCASGTWLNINPDLSTGCP